MGGGVPDTILRPHMHVDPHTGRHAEKERGQREREKKSEKEEGKKSIRPVFVNYFFRLLS